MIRSTFLPSLRGSVDCMARILQLQYAVSSPGKPLIRQGMNAKALSWEQISRERAFIVFLLYITFPDYDCSGLESDTAAGTNP